LAAIRHHYSEQVLRNAAVDLIVFAEAAVWNLPHLQLLFYPVAVALY
jgi:hypothetical protein